VSAPLAGADFALLALQLAAVAALVASALRLVTALAPPLGRGERAVAVAVVAAAQAVVLVQVLGFAGALAPLPLAVGIALAAVAAAAAGRGRGPVPPVRREARDGAALAVALAAALALAPVAARALLTVPTEWDGLTYHLFYPATWLQQGSLAPVAFGPPHDQTALYPANGELVHALLMAFVRSDLLVASGMVAFAVLFGVAVAALARAEGAGAAAATAAGALAATTPALASRAASSYVEPLLDFALVAALLLTRRALAEPARAPGAAALAGLAAGLAAGTKLTALPLAAWLGVALAGGLAFARVPWRRTLAAGALYAGGATLTGGAWYVRNLALAGNPFFPAPWLGLPHLERAGLVWEGSSLAERWRELARDGLLGDALFALPPARLPAMSLGWAQLVLLPLAAAGIVLALRAARAELRRGERCGALARLVAPAGLLVLALTYLRLPYWDNPGLFRSEVRFAVPAAAVAAALALAALSRGRVSGRWMALLGGAGVAVQVLQAGLAAPLPGLARGVALVGVPLAGAGLLGALAPRLRTMGRAAALAAALALVALGLFAAWAYREAGRERRWLAEDAVFRPFAAAALAAERARPGAAAVAWATSSHNEFLALFTGRRLERRVIAVPVHPGPEEGFRYRDGDPRRTFEREFWRAALERARPDLLVVSRWRAWRELWPPEDAWARAEGFPLVADLPELRVYEVPPPGAQGTRGANQPESQPSAR